MKETIYLIASRYKVERMVKNLPQLHRGEIPVKLEIEIEPDAYREPVISKQVHIADWREGVDIGDVELKEGTITEEEAEMIRQQRRERMVEVLQAQGYTVTPPIPQPEEGQSNG